MPEVAFEHSKLFVLNALQGLGISFHLLLQGIDFFGGGLGCAAHNNEEGCCQEEYDDSMIIHCRNGL